MIALIRVRGLTNVRHDIRQTLDVLNLDRKNHCVLVPDNKVNQGMIHKAKDYIAYGNVSPETIAKLLQKRGRIPGDKRVTEEVLKQHKLNSFEDAGKAVSEGKVTLKALGIKPVFRLNSPKGGFSRKGIKKSASVGGPLGHHKDGLDALIGQMM